MRLLKNHLPLTCTLFFIFLAFGCKDAPKAPPVIDKAFSSYVSAFTSGVISTGSQIIVRFTNPFKEGVSAGDKADQSWLSFSPTIDGELVWLNEQTLQFIPASQLPSDKEYEGVLLLDEFTDVPDNLKEFKFFFKTMKQHMEISVENVRPYDAKTMKWQFLQGALRTFDLADADKVKESLTVSQNNKALNIKWTHDSEGKIHQFTVDSIRRTEKQGLVVIKWDGKPLMANQEGRKDEIIPALGDFKIIETRIVQHPDQHVVIRFSDPLDDKQNLDGLIMMNEVGNLRFAIDHNEIKVYPPFRIAGTMDMDVSRGIKNILGYKLKEELILNLAFETIKPMVDFADESGTILPSTDGLLFPFRAVSLKAVDVRIVQVFEDNVPQFLQVNAINGDREIKRVGRVVRKKTVNLNPEGNTDLAHWNTFHLDLNDLINTQKGAIYRVEIGFRREQALTECGDVPGEDVTASITEEWDEYSEEEHSFWDYYDSYYYNYYYDDYYYDYDYDWDFRDDPCNKAYYKSKPPIARNIIATDLGLIAKRGNDGSILVAASDLVSTKPLEGVKIEVLNFQQTVLKSGKTGANGMINFKDLSANPFLVVASKGDQRAYVKMDRGSSLSLSKFDVAGMSVQQGIKGFFYGERGVWRPGDTLFLSFMLEDENKKLPASHPITFELVDPHGKVVEKNVQPNNKSGLFSFTTKTRDDAPTGNWNARVKVGGALFNKTVKVETIKPNRLKINIDFGKDHIGVDDKGLKGQMLVSWLHGAPARKLRAKVGATFSAIPTRFERYQDYRFDDLVRRFESSEQVIFDQRVDEDGLADIAMAVDLQQRAPGMLKAHLNTKVFEEGGEFSVDRFSIPYSPYASYVGMKLPKGDRSRGMLLTDKQHTVDVMTVDSDGKPVKHKNLEYSVYKVSWRWWWSSYNDDLSQFESADGVETIDHGVFSTATDGTGSFNFEVNYPEWGRYLVRIIDPSSGHACSQTVYIDWPGWAGRAQRENPGGESMLVFSTDKDTYQVGDKCTITFPSAAVGRALVSIETGSKVLHASWVEAEKDQTSYSFTITEDMAPNAYVNITLVQPHAQTANDLPIRLYGVMPVLVDDPSTHLTPIVKMPESIRPEEKFTVQVSEKSGKLMHYTVAVVDEGLLDLTRFSTPDPWNYFYAREALGVTTWDLYDDVIGAYGSGIEHLLSLGGGDDGEAAPGKNKANRFKPVVHFLGPFELKPGQTAKHELQMSNYVGSVRTMVVARENDAYGHAETTTPVKKPLMVLATLPRVLGPKEEVKLPVTIFAMDESIKEVEVKLEVNSILLNQGSSTQTVKFNKIGDKVINFDLKVAEALGIGTAKVTVKCGKEVSTHEIELDVRNPNPEITNVIEGYIAVGGSWETTYALPGVAGTNEALLEVSSIPAIDFNRRLRYLIGYPHGCLEQTTSKAFPQLYIADVVDLPLKMQQRASDHVKVAVSKIQSFMLPSGGMSYWPGEWSASDWGTSYAGHFVLEAEKKGYYVSPDFKTKWVNYQRQSSQNYVAVAEKNDGLYRLDDLVQAYRLYTLALANSPELSAMNRLRETDNLSTQAIWRLAAAYQLAGQPEIAEELIKNATTKISDYRALSHHYGSNWRDAAMIIETLTLMNKREKAAPMVIEMAKMLASDYWCSTHTTSYALMAISKFAVGEKNAQTRYVFFLNEKEGKETLSSKPVALEQLTVDQAYNTVKVHNTSENGLFVRVITSGQPMKGDEKTVQQDLNMSVVYTDMSGALLDVSRIEQGTDFMVNVTISHPGIRYDFHEMALTQIFPSGWEIHNTRLDQVASVHQSNLPRYQDIRDDRVYSYFDISRRHSQTYTILLNASYQGKFYLPSVACEAMYDETINARVPGKWVHVVAPGEMMAGN